MVKPVVTMPPIFSLSRHTQQTVILVYGITKEDDSGYNRKVHG